MKNLWVTYDEPCVTWTINLTIEKDKPESLLQWYEKILRAGEMNAVYKIRSATQLDYSWERDGFIWQQVIRQYQQNGVINLFDFATGGVDKKATILARVGYFGWQGQFVEEDEEDLGQLLYSLRLENADRADAYMRSCNPISIHWGELVDFHDFTTQNWKQQKVEIRLFIKLYSDIWFPWVYGYLEDEYDSNKRFSNHELAGYHTPRLNEFLNSVRDATLSIDGKWELDRDVEATHRSLLFMLNEDGINLNAKLPDGITENFLLNPEP